jgi:hypothetical protein
MAVSTQRARGTQRRCGRGLTAAAWRALGGVAGVRARRPCRASLASLRRSPTRKDDDVSEADRFVELHDACHRVLAHLGAKDDQIADAVRETCRLVEARLSELGVKFESAFES